MIGRNENRIEDHGRIKVRRALERDDWLTDAILDLAANGQRDWTPAEWFDLLMDLETSDMTISEFLDFYG